MTDLHKGQETDACEEHSGLALARDAASGRDGGGGGSDACGGRCRGGGGGRQLRATPALGQRLFLLRVKLTVNLRRGSVKAQQNPAAVAAWVIAPAAIPWPMPPPE